MRIKRSCKICGKMFFAIKTNQFFCSRKCFKKDYYVRMKTKKEDEKNSLNFPVKKCNFCGKTHKLTFDPIKEPRLFNEAPCPECGVSNKLMWENQHKANSKMIITEFIDSHPIVTIKKVEDKNYKIPIRRIGEYEPSILFLTCKITKITDVQRGDRRKIVFS